MSPKHSATANTSDTMEEDACTGIVAPVPVPATESDAPPKSAPQGFYANGHAFDAKEGNILSCGNNMNLFRRPSGDFFYIRADNRLTVEVPEYLMKKFLVFDAMV
ncbi:hypothetical protein C0995_002652 [Termitomyces sp. Mi166|nr:hypothetical protein C0995_002652 [Termitomyces sp. Mi166\